MDLCRCRNNHWCFGVSVLPLGQIRLITIPPHPSDRFHRVRSGNCVALHPFFLLFQRPCSRFPFISPCLWFLLHFWSLALCVSNSGTVLSRKMRFDISVPSNFPLLRCPRCLHSLSEHSRNCFNKNLPMKCTV